MDSTSAQPNPHPLFHLGEEGYKNLKNNEIVHLNNGGTIQFDNPDQLNADITKVTLLYKASADAPEERLTLNIGRNHPLTKKLNFEGKELTPEQQIIAKKALLIKFTLSLLPVCNIGQTVIDKSIEDTHNISVNNEDKGKELINFKERTRSGQMAYLLSDEKINKLARKIKSIGNNDPRTPAAAGTLLQPVRAATMPPGNGSPAATGLQGAAQEVANSIGSLLKTLRTPNNLDEVKNTNDLILWLKQDKNNIKIALEELKKEDNKLDANGAILATAFKNYLALLSFIDPAFSDLILSGDDINDELKREINERLEPLKSFERLLNQPEEGWPQATADGIIHLVSSFLGRGASIKKHIITTLYNRNEKEIIDLLKNLKSDLTSDNRQTIIEALKIAGFEERKANELISQEDIRALFQSDS